MAKQNDAQTYALSIVVAIALAAVAIGGLNALGFATNAPGTATAQVASTVSITLPTASVDLGYLAQGAQNQTSGGATATAFVLQNDGNVKVNATINATSLWTATASNPTANYSFAANNSSEGNCYINGPIESTTTWTNMPASGSATKFLGQLNYTNSCDSVKIEINVTVPTDEGTGAKSSTVTVVATQS